MSEIDRAEYFWPPSNDTFAIGAHGQSRLPVVIIDPEKFDKTRIAAYMDKLKETGLIASIFSDDLDEGNKIVKGNPELEKLWNDFVNDLGDQVRTQIASQNQAITYGKSNRELAAIGFGALFSGPFSLKYDHQEGMACIINRPNKEETLEVLSATLAEVEVGRLKPLPYNEALFQYVVGVHEGQHCNQPRVKSRLDTLNAEIDADFKSFEALKQQGQVEAVQAIMDLRTLGAVNGLLSGPDYPTHATAFFIGENGPIKATADDVKVLFEVREAMLQLVVDRLGPEANIEGAQYLREMDPEKFDRLLMEGLKEGPLTRPMRESEKWERIIEEMKASLNLSGDEIRKLDTEDPKKFQKIYDETEQKLRDQGEFVTSDPAMQRIAQMYVEAYERRIQDAPKPDAPAADVSQATPTSGNFDYLAQGHTPLPPKGQASSGTSVNWDSGGVTVSGWALRDAFSFHTNPAVQAAVLAEFKSVPSQIVIPAPEAASSAPKLS